MIYRQLRPGQRFVRKALAACALAAAGPAGGVRHCDPAVNVTVVSETLWDGITPAVPAYM